MMIMKKCVNVYKRQGTCDRIKREEKINEKTRQNKKKNEIVCLW
jgi:hypothetical protein